MTTMTVAIPTYNRSARLVAQLDRLAPDVVAEGGRCRVLVSDNCSTDDTADALARWVAAHPEVPITVRRNDANLGVMRNIAACARAADAEFVWILGDDDELPPGTLRRLLGLLEAHPDLTLLSVNYSMHDVAQDIEMTPARMVLRDDVVKAGPSPLTALDDQGVALVKMMGFMSGQVYRTTEICRAIDAWPAFDNLDVQIFWSGFCAAQGTTLVKAEPFLRYDCGTNALAKPRVWYQTHVIDNAWVFLRLRRIGYPVDLCRSGILSAVDTRHELRHTLSGVLRWPLLGLKAFAVLAFTAAAVHLPGRAGAERAAIASAA